MNAATAPEFRHFEVGDGFVISLVLILWLVLTGIAVVAYLFRKRERNVPNTSETEEPNDSIPEPAQSSRFHKFKPDTKPWERDANWWKQNND